MGIECISKTSKGRRTQVRSRSVHQRSTFVQLRIQSRDTSLYICFFEKGIHYNWSQVYISQFSGISTQVIQSRSGHKWSILRLKGNYHLFHFYRIAQFEFKKSFCAGFRVTRFFKHDLSINDSRVACESKITCEKPSSLFS